MGTGFKAKRLEYVNYFLIFAPIVSIVLFSGFTVDDWGQLSMDTTLQDQISNWRELGLIGRYPGWLFLQLFTYSAIITS